MEDLITGGKAEAETRYVRVNFPGERLSFFVRTEKQSIKAIYQTHTYLDFRRKLLAGKS